MTYSVLVCDDTDLGIEWANDVRTVVSKLPYKVLDPPDKKPLRDAIQEVFARQCSLHEDPPRERATCMFDSADILILDYDLLHIDEHNARHTGESLARLVRLFTTAGVVVVVNQFGGVHFDLSLRGHLSSHADLNLDADLLDTRGLWTGPPWDGFRPWHWQTLSRAVETHKTRQRVVREHFDEPIVEVLGMQEEDIARLSDAAFGFIAPNAGDWQGIREQTFRSFVDQVLHSFAGMRKPAKGRSASVLFDADKEAVYRFAASRVGKWLERRVLAPQDALVDLPHLIQFYPFLLGKDMAELDAWNAAVHGNESLRGRVPDGCWFESGNVLSRPAVWRQRVVDDPAFRAARGKFDYSTVPAYVFLEDESSFAPLDEAKQFRAGHHNAFDGRFVKRIDGFNYAPQRRLAYASNRS